MAKVFKITHGFVTQTFQDEKCVEQEFIAGDQVDWEDENGDGITPPGCYEYQTFHMVQPGMDRLGAHLTRDPKIAKYIQDNGSNSKHEKREEAKMKLIIIYDGCEHIHAYVCSLPNLRRLVNFLVEQNKFNTILEEDPPNDLLSRTEEEIEAWIEEYGPVGRSRANRVNFVEVENEINILRIDL